MFRKGDRRLLGAVLVLIGGLLLATALFMPWYSNDYTGSNPAHFDILFYLGPSSWDGTIQYSCSAGVHCPSATSYSSGSLNNSGVVAEVTLALVAAACVLGLYAGAIGIRFRRDASRTRKTIILAVTALGLAVTAAAFYAATIQVSWGGSWSSFWGSSTGYSEVSGTVSNSWGPSIGWYLSIVAIAALLAGTVILLRHRRESTEAVSPSAASGPTPESNPQTSTT